jgi:peptide deformylase
MDASAANAQPTVLLLGDRRLRERARRVDEPGGRAAQAAGARLHAALAGFRARHGFGRAIAAPQIGVSLRLVAANLGRGPLTLVNPRILGRSAETFTLWDDCMSFPELLVRVRRAASITLEFEDEHGATQRWSDLERAESELFQHELDHLDGILALDRALDREAVVAREVFERERERWLALVDGPSPGFPESAALRRGASC